MNLHLYIPLLLDEIFTVTWYFYRLSLFSRKGHVYLLEFGHTRKPKFCVLGLDGVSSILIFLITYFFLVWHLLSCYTYMSIPQDGSVLIWFSWNEEKWLTSNHVSRDQNDSLRQNTVSPES